MFKFLYLLLLIPSLINAAAIPENGLSRPVGAKSNNEEKIFNTLIDKVEKAYRPYIESYSKEFNVERYWDDPKVNAAAWIKGDSYNFKIYGGLFRFETISHDAFLLVACHEVGHLIGGAPTYKPFNDGSSEGQADYFSITKCFRKVVRGDDHKKTLRGKSLEPLAIKECELSFSKKSEDYQICLRSSVAIKDMAKTLKAISNITEVPSINTPDPYERMFIIFNGYPNPQCRIDTLFAGSLCNVSEEEENDFYLKLYNKGNCAVANGDQRGLRPKCWYVPREEDQV